MQLVYKNKTLDDSKKLYDYNIQNDSIIHLILKTGNFVDITNNFLKSILGFSKAPIWRTSNYGLNLEGKCKNNKCKAY
jgi:hypothetical protein